MVGRDDWSRLAALVPARRDYYEHWRARGDELPPVLGTVPERVDDPIMTELFGLTPEYFATIRTASPLPS